MDIVKLKSQIKKKELDNFYIFVGEEIGLMNLYLEKMSENILRVDNLAGVWKRLTSRGLGKDKPFYVVRDDKEFIQSEKIWSTAKSSIKYGTVVLLYTSLDKRSRFYKAFEDSIVVFDKMTQAQLVNFITKDKLGLSEKEAEYLCEACNNDYTQITLELDKLNRVGITNERIEDVIDEIVKAPKYADTFAMANNVIQYNAQKAMTQMQYLLDNGESGIGMITVLYNNFRAAVQVLCESGSSKEISERTGLNPYTVSNILNNFDYSLDGAEKALGILQDAESGIKTGKYDEDKAPLIALCKILNLE